MEAETQTVEEQVNIIEPSDPINYSYGHWTFCSWHRFYGLWCWNWKPLKTVRTDFTSAKDCQAVLHNWPRWLWLRGRWFWGFLCAYFFMPILKKNPSIQNLNETTEYVL